MRAYPKSDEGMNLLNVELTWLPAGDIDEPCSWTLWMSDLVCWTSWRHICSGFDSISLTRLISWSPDELAAFR